MKEMSDIGQVLIMLGLSLMSLEIRSIFSILAWPLLSVVVVAVVAL